MIQIEKERERTDRAWNKLYGRLHEEDLFSTTSNPTSHRSAVLKWTLAAVAVIAFCVYGTVAYFSPDAPKELPNLLTQHNNESSTLVTTLEDGSVVYLFGETSLRYPEHFASHKREVSLSGNAFFDITGNRVRPFSIETNEVKIEVIGTSFDVRTDANTPFELSVKRGLVRVTSKKTGQTMQVKAGETVKLLAEKLQLSVLQNAQQFARYTKQMRFKDQRLADILRVVNKQGNGVRLEASPALGERVLTVSLSDNSPQAVAELICLAFNLKCTSKNGVLTLSK